MEWQKVSPMAKNRPEAHLRLLLLAVAVLVLTIQTTSAAITIQETVTSLCTAPITLHCSNKATDFQPQALAPSASVTMAVTTSLSDPDLVCTFASPDVPALNVTPPKQLKLWEYLKMGFTDSPEMSCDAGCLWVAKDDGLYYRAGGTVNGAESLFISWAAILPNLPV